MNCDNLNKRRYKKLIYEARELPITIFCEYRLGRILVNDKDRAQRIYTQSIHRHWRRVAKYNKLFGENLYISSWYIAEMEQE